MICNHTRTGLSVLDIEVKGQFYHALFNHDMKIVKAMNGKNHAKIKPNSTIWKAIQAQSNRIRYKANR